MAEDSVVSVVKKRKDCLESFKMHGNLVNGLLHEKEETISKILGGNGKNMNNGHQIIPQKSNGLYNHKSTSPVGEAIRAPSLRSSPIRNNVIAVNSSDSSKTEGKDEVR